MRTIKKGLAYRRVAGELFVVDAAKARLHELNGVGAAVWEGLAKGRSSREIAASIAEDYEVEPARALRDTEDFIAELGEAGLLEGK